jgi:farnesyl-diphosphate farnesyltransferase
MSGYGVGWTQDDMMKKDQCILLDNDDNMIGHASKVASHQFNEETPRGLLHRAFSVFMFNQKGELLLQQRASDKITFPGVWTNTCCSHPLYGYTPSEVDSPENVANGKVDGVISAAIRKLEHELGIPVGAVPAKSFKFLTRLHYWAADVVTHGKKSPWGEHEIDYILFCEVPNGFKVEANPEEVSDTKWVSASGLKKMMNPKNGLLWSPWFRIIAEKFLIPAWWADLRETMTTNAYVDYNTIHRFDPTKEHMGGGGDAGSWLGTVDNPISKTKQGNSGSKQGAYGKVQTHKHSKLSQLAHFDEIFAAVWFKVGAPMPNKVDRGDESVRFCDDMLVKVSRSFAAVIQQLPKGLCIDIMIFYLVLRALDTIEDDMQAFKGNEGAKVKHLEDFYKTALVTDGWTMEGVGEGDEMVLLNEFHHVVRVFKSLSRGSQEVIADITRKMGGGMAYYVGIDLGQGTVTTADYNKYCHYVAGLVGEGLSRLFTCTGYESPRVAAVCATTANTMGLFLQKTNIIRDYLEDYVDGRAFWPQEIWKLYAPAGADLGHFSKPQNQMVAVSLLNHLITDALECIPECIDYMALLKTEEVFRFCAIPQVMAIATLAELYNNPKVFTGVVKIRKCQAAKLILDTKSVGGLHKWFNVLSRNILSRVPPNQLSSKRTIDICNTVIRLTDGEATREIAGSYGQVGNVIASSLLALSTYKIFSVGNKSQKMLSLLSSGGATFATLRSTITAPVASHSSVLSPSGWVSVFGFSLIFIFGYSVAASGRERLRRADK